MPQVGTEFAGYRLEELVGTGGMSMVYRAQHLRLERTVALKVLMPELSQDDSFKERFTRESRLAASLDHPNVIPIYEAGDEGGVFYIAMRFVGGSTLKHVLETDGPLPAARAASVMSQVASALHAAHEEKGLVHRDVKPANILVVSGHGAEGGDHVYLSDFGIAKQRAAGALTKTGMFVGTADYAAPEQIEGRELDRRADVYALGCVLYETLTGAPTYEKDSEVALMYAHLLEPPPQVTHKRPDLSPEIDAVVAKAMAKSPDDRYATTPEFATAMRKALIGTETRLTQQSDQVRVPETVLTAGAVGTAAAPPAEPPPPAAQPAPLPAEPDAGGPKRKKWLLPVAIILLLLIAGGIVGGILALTGGSSSSKTAGSFLDVLVPSEVANACTQQRNPERTAVETDVCTPDGERHGGVPGQPDAVLLLERQGRVEGVRRRGLEERRHGRLRPLRPQPVEGRGNLAPPRRQVRRPPALLRRRQRRLDRRLDAREEGLPEPRGHVRARQGARTRQHGEPVQLVEPVPPADREVPRAGLRGRLHGHDQEDHRRSKTPHSRH